MVIQTAKMQYIFGESGYFFVSAEWSASKAEWGVC